MFSDALSHVRDVVPQSLVGAGLILAASVLGWIEGAHHRGLPARLVAWWLRRVVKPLLGQRRWAPRAFTIFVNNSCVCGLMVLAGATAPAAWLAVAGVGLSLGIALHTMLPAVPHAAIDPTPADRAGRCAATIGVLLNLLELPAIACSAGLCLAQSALWPELEPVSAAMAFGVLVVPTLALAASGEALWMGVYYASFDKIFLRSSLDPQ